MRSFVEDKLRICGCGAVWGVVLLILAVVGQLDGQEPAAEESQINLLVKSLLSDATEPSIREELAANLFGNAEAHSTLVEVLEEEGNLKAKTIICRVIATRQVEFLRPDNQAAVPPAFIDPLFKVLGSENRELSRWAGQALARARNGVVKGLAQISRSTDRPLSERLAAIGVLELMPDKQAVLALAKQINDRDRQIRRRARQAVAARLGLDEGVVDWDQFGKRYLARLTKTSDDEFLWWQLVVERRKVMAAEEMAQASEQKALHWQDYCLEEIRRQFEQKQGREKVAFLREQLSRYKEEAIRITALELLNGWCRSAAANPDVAIATVTFLTEFISDENAELRRLAAESLAQVGEKGRALAELLDEQLQKETDAGVQAALLGALGNFSYDPARDQYLRFLEADDPAVVAQAARALASIVGPTNNLTDKQVRKISQSVTKAYQRSTDTAPVRNELIKVMETFAGQDKYRRFAKDKFGRLLEQALADSEPLVRQSAVYALTTMHGQAVLELLGERESNLVNDPNPRVRFAIVKVIDEHGVEDHLGLLRRRLAKESVADVITDAIIPAWQHILERLSPEQVCHWMLQTTAQASEREHLLHRKALEVLLQKITEAQKAGRRVELEHLEHGYGRKAALAELDNQPEQAMNWYGRLLSLGLSQQKRSDYLTKALSLALAHSDKEAVLTRAEEFVSAGTADAVGAGALAEIAEACDALDPNAPAQLLRHGRIIAALIKPIAKYPTAQDKQNWTDRTVRIALRLIEQQQEALAGEDGQVNTQVLTLLARLDERLSGFPADGTLAAEKQAMLERFHRLLQPPAPLQQPSPSADQTKSSPSPSSADAPVLPADDPNAPAQSAVD